MSFIYLQRVLAAVGKSGVSKQVFTHPPSLDALLRSGYEPRVTRYAHKSII